MTQTPVYDLAIIGGGIAGAGIARDAALRGARVLLLEQQTFGSGTSSKSSRLIHGGIRYLEIAWSSLCRGDLGEAVKNFRFVFSALAECRTLERIAPDLVRPVELVIPIYADDARGPWTVYAGTWLYYLLAVGSGGGRRPRILRGPDAVKKVVPPLKAKGLRGAVAIWDRTTDDRELVLRTLRSAQDNGAVCLEKTEVIGWDRDAASGVFKIKTQIASADGGTVHLARALVNASGPWIDRVRALAEPGTQTQPLISPVAGSHLTVPKFLPVSTLLQARDKRIFFCLNVGEQCRIGTTERVHEGDPGRVEATDAEIDYLLESARFYFPDSRLSRADILSTDAGIRPLARPDKEADAHTTSREHVITRGASGAVHVTGVKLTDHRRAAEDVLAFILPDLLRHTPQISRRSTTAHALL